MRDSRHFGVPTHRNPRQRPLIQKTMIRTPTTSATRGLPTATELPRPDTQPPENKNKPVEQGNAGCPTDKTQKDDKKDKSDNSPSAAIDKNQGNQLGAVASAATGDAKNGLQLEGGGDVSTQAETQAIPNTILPAAKDAKIKEAADYGQPANAQLPASEAIGISAAQEANLPVSASGKQMASEMTAAQGTENAAQPAAAQAVAIVAAAGENAIFADKASKDVRAAPRNAEANAADQDGKTQFLAGPAADAALLPSAGQNAPAAAAALAIAITPPAINPPLMPAKLVKDKTDRIASDKPADVAPADKAADPLNALQRAGSSASKTTASQQGGSDESGSNLSGVRFVQRVEQAFAAMSDRGGAVRIKLSPPELGSLSVEISVDNGVMKAHVETETKEAKNLLLENLPALRDRLAQQNIKIQKFDVDLRDPSSGGTSQQSADQAETRSGSGGYRAPRPQIRKTTPPRQPTKAPICCSTTVN